MKPVSKEHPPTSDVGSTAVRIGVVGNLLAIANSASILLLAPPGAAIRPMHAPVYLLMIAAGTVLMAIPFAIAALFRPRERSMGVLGIVLGLCPLFVGLCSFLQSFIFSGIRCRSELSAGTPPVLIVADATSPNPSGG